MNCDEHGPEDPFGCALRRGLTPDQRDALARNSAERRSAAPWWEGGSPEDRRTEEWYREVLEKLKALPRPAPAQLRRIAELTEMLGSESEALRWWQEAAEAGDRDARDMIALLLGDKLSSRPPDPH